MPAAGAAAVDAEQVLYDHLEGADEEEPGAHQDLHHGQRGLCLD